MRRFYREYAWKDSTAKVSPSETYPLYGIISLILLIVQLLLCRQPSSKEVKLTETTSGTTPTIINSSNVDTAPPLRPSPAN